MLLTFSAESALDVANVLTDKTPETLSDAAKLIYKALVWVSVEVIKDRAYKDTVTEVTWFCPAESVALACGIHPATLYRRLPELCAAGLVAVRGHYTTHNGQTRSDGSVWTVRLTPTRGSAARVPYDYLKKQYRCLGDDIDNGNTAWAQVRESKTLEVKTEINIKHILRWALSRKSKNPVTSDSRMVPRCDLESIFDVPAVDKQERADMVYQAAVSLSTALNDQESTRWYCKLLWGLLRLRDRGSGDFFESLYLVANRCRADVVEGWAKEGNGGRLLISRVKAASWYQPAMNGVPPN